MWANKFILIANQGLPSKSTPDTLLTPDHFNGDVTGQVLAVGCLNSVELFHRAEDVGVRGLIVGSASADVCRVSLDSPLPLLVTDGVGSGGMAPPIFELLHQADGRSVSLFGDYKAEAGQRPEIYFAPGCGVGVGCGYR